MIKIGLTGSIGMGKSTVAAMFARSGIRVFDADAHVHDLQGRGGELTGAIEARFPGSTDANGVDRAALGAAVFGNPIALAALEAIVHPAVARRRAGFLRVNRARRIVVLDIPLLLETRGWRGVDVVVVVSAPAWQQRRRVLDRTGMTYAKFKRIRRLQMPDVLKRKAADVIIETGRTKAETGRQVRVLIACLRAQSRR